MRPQRRRGLELLPILGACYLFAIAAITLLAWLCKWGEVLRVFSHLSAIACDTALLFLLSAISLLNLTLRRYGAATVTAVIVSVVGLLGLTVGRAPGVFFSIHRFFPKWTISVMQLPDAAYMSMVLPVALIFLLSGCGLLFAVAADRLHRAAFWGVALIGPALIGIGLLGVFTLAGDLHTMSGQEPFLIRMSFWTMTGTMALGASLCCLFATRHWLAREHLAISLAMLAAITLFFIRSGMDYAVFINGDVTESLRQGLGEIEVRAQALETVRTELRGAENLLRSYLLTGNDRDVKLFSDRHRAARLALDSMTIPYPSMAQGLSRRAILKEQARMAALQSATKSLRMNTDKQLRLLTAVASLEVDGQHTAAVEKLRSSESDRSAIELEQSAEGLAKLLERDKTTAEESDRRSFATVRRAVQLSALVSSLFIPAAIALIFLEFWRWEVEQRRLRLSESLLEAKVNERTQDLLQEAERRLFAERELRRGQELLETSLASARVATWTWLPAEDRIYWAGPVAAVFGRTESRLQSYVDFTAMVHPEDRERLNDAVRESLAGMSTYHAEFRVLTPEGDTYWVEGVGNALFRNGVLVQMSGVNTNISERKRMELELRKSEQQFRHLADAMPQIVWQARGDGKFDFCNSRWYQATGLPSDTDLNRSWWEVLHPEDLPLFRQRWQECLESSSDFELEIRLKTADAVDRYRWNLVRALSIRDGEGRSPRWFGTMTDIHSQKTAEEVLEAEVNLRTRDLRRALHEKDVLFREVHHRVKNNLQVVSSLLNMQAQLMSDDAARAALGDSRQRVLSMSLIHERLYSQSRMEIEFTEYVEALVRDVLLVSSRSTGLQTEVHCDPDIYLEPDQAIPCGLILNELVTNAFKYAYPEGEGDIRIEVRESDNVITLSVEDDGVGLRPDFNLKKNSSLGLSIVQSLAHQLGGRLAIDRDRRGIRVTVEFEPLRRTFSNLAAVEA